MIKLTNLVKKYDDLTALKGISLTINRGEMFGMLGPNGAGKSTTINLIAGAISPDGGEISLDGKVDPTRMTIRKMMGIAPQALAIYDEMTGSENVRFFAQLYGLSGKQLKEQVEWALDFVALFDRAKDRAKTYSGGMQRRLNLACAIVHAPSILLLDEPTVGVDPQSRNMIFEKIEQLKKNGCTIIYSTHYMEEAQRMCDRVAIIDHGQILAVDNVEQLITEHGGTSLVKIELVEPIDNNLIDGEKDGLTVRMQTSNPIEIINDLKAKNIKYKSLNIDRPDLETVFLNLTGRSLRDG